jgi:hypothetical protein
MERTGPFRQPTTEVDMKLPVTLALLLGSAFAIPALAQTTTSETQRDTYQQQRIESGLQSGALTTHETGTLERDESHVDRLQTQALKDGTLSPAESARIKAAQNKAGAAIAADKHNAKLGNPQSKSSRRMQADVQRNANQQARIEKGAASGALSNREVAALEHGQKRVDRTEANAAANGHVGPYEQARAQGREDLQSARIHRQKHD